MAKDSFILGACYLSHVAPEDGKGATIGRCLYGAFENTKLETELALVGSDGTSTMTGYKTGAIRTLECLCGRPLSRSICQLHMNELPLRHIVMILDGTTKSPDAFSGKIGKNLNDIVSTWKVVKFKPIRDTKVLDQLLSYPDNVVEDLSTDQNYGYKICLAILTGDMPKTLALREIGPLCHARWLTLACRVLRYCVRQKNPSKNLKDIAEFCVKVYFPSWFNIKKNKYITDGPRNLHFLVEKTMSFPDKKVRDIAMRYIQINAYFAHPENILLGMLNDDDQEVRNVAVNIVLKQRGDDISDVDGEDLLPNEFEGGYISDEDGNVGEANESSDIRYFKVPKINNKAKVYYKLVNMKEEKFEEPPILRKLRTHEIENFRNEKLVLRHPCHSQAVERSVKVVSEACAEVIGFQRRDGLIRQTLKSRKLQPKVDCKKHYYQK